MITGIAVPANEQLQRTMQTGSRRSAHAPLHASALRFMRQHAFAKLRANRLKRSPAIRRKKAQMAYHKQLERAVSRHRWRGASASFRHAIAARSIWLSAAAEVPS
jgi:hypothetical protein